MKIGILTERMLLGFGVDLVVHEQATRLAAAGHEVTVFCERADQHTSRDYDLRVLRKSYPWFHNFTDGHGIKRFLEHDDAADIDIWILHTPPFYGWVQFIETPVVFVEYGTPPGYHFEGEVAHHVWRVRGEHLRGDYRFLRDNDAIVSISQDIHRSLPDFAQPYSKVVLLGGDHYAEARTSDAQHFRHSLGLSDRDVLLLWVGRMQFSADEQPYKGFAELRELLPQFKRLGRQVKIACLGKIDSRDLRAMNKLDVIVLPNHAPERMGVAYAAADVLVNLSRWEGFNLALLEAQFQGTPVVAYRYGPHSEIVRSGTTGLLVNDRAELVEAVGRLVHDDSLRAAMSAEAKRFAQGHLWDENVRQLEAVLEQCLRGPQRPGSRRAWPERRQFFPALDIPTAPVAVAPAEPLEIDEGQIQKVLQAEPHAFLRQAYDLLLGRLPDPAGVEHYERRLANGRSRSSILHELIGSKEFRERGVTLPPAWSVDVQQAKLRRLVRGIKQSPRRIARRHARSVPELFSRQDQAFVEAAYHLILNRAPDPSGLAYYTNRIRQTGDKVRIARELARSSEAAAAGGVPFFIRLGIVVQRAKQLVGERPVPSLLLLDGEQFVNAAYHTILGRSPDAGGKQHFFQWLMATGDKRAILLHMCHSAEARQRASQFAPLQRRLESRRMTGRDSSGANAAIAERLTSLDREMRRLADSATRPVAVAPIGPAPALIQPGNLPSTPDYVCLLAPRAGTITAAAGHLINTATTSGADIMTGDELIVTHAGTATIVTRSVSEVSADPASLGGCIAVRRKLLHACSFDEATALTPTVARRLLGAAHTVGYLAGVAGYRKAAADASAGPSATGAHAAGQAGDMEQGRGQVTVLVMAGQAKGQKPLSIKAPGRGTGGMTITTARATDPLAPELINRAVADTAADIIVVVEHGSQPLAADWCSRIVATAQRQGVGLVGGVALMADDAVCDLGWAADAAGGLRPIGRFDPYPATADPAPAHPVTAVAPQVAAFSRAAFVAVGGMNESFGIELSWLDLSLRLRELGFVVLVDPGCALRGAAEVHRHGLAPDDAYGAFKDRHYAVLAQPDRYSRADAERVGEQLTDADIGALLMRVTAQQPLLVVRAPEPHGDAAASRVS